MNCANKRELKLGEVLALKVTFNLPHDYVIFLMRNGVDVGKIIFRDKDQFEAFVKMCQDFLRDSEEQMEFY